MSPAKGIQHHRKSRIQQARVADGDDDGPLSMGEISKHMLQGWRQQHQHLLRSQKSETSSWRVSSRGDYDDSGACATNQK